MIEIGSNNEVLVNCSGGVYAGTATETGRLPKYGGTFIVHWTQDGQPMVMTGVWCAELHPDQNWEIQAGGCYSGSWIPNLYQALPSEVDTWLKQAIEEEIAIMGTATR